MTCDSECTQFDLAMGLLIENGFEGIAEAVGLLMSTALKTLLANFRQPLCWSPVGDASPSLPPSG